MSVVDFLLARIAEDEEIAREATNDGHRWLVEEETISLWPDDLEPATGNIHFPRKAHAYHAATWDPARVLAECAAKRRIVAEYADSEFCERDAWGDAVAILAAVYADHADYDAGWAVED